MIEQRDEAVAKVVYEARRLLANARQTRRGVPSEMWRLENRVLELEALEDKQKHGEYEPARAHRRLEFRK